MKGIQYKKNIYLGNLLSYTYPVYVTIPGLRACATGDLR
jgi:hypothetical protein